MTSCEFLVKHPQVNQALISLVREAKLLGTPADAVITQWHDWLLINVSPRATRELAIELFIA